MKFLLREVTRKKNEVKDETRRDIIRKGSPLRRAREGTREGFGAWSWGDLTPKVRVSIARPQKKHGLQQLNNRLFARFGAAALQPFSVLRPFYERRIASFVRESRFLYLLAPLSLFFRPKI